MVRIKALDELTLADLWREAPQDEEFWRETQERQRQVLKQLLEGALEAELVQLVGAARYRRTERRRGYRHGFYQRDLATQIGIVKAIRVPRARPRAGERAVFRRYQRRQAQVNALIREIFLAGVSTRRVGEVLERILGERVSAQTVSRVARSLDREVARFHEAPLSDDVRYLLLDGVSMRVKGAAGVKRRLVLCAYAITVAGQRRLLAFRLAQGESEAAWEAFLSQLRERGLWGQQLRLIVTDGCPGLHAALATVYPYVPRQRCWVHKLRNVSTLLKRCQQQECLASARAIYQAATRREAVRAYWAWARRWRGEASKAVACLEGDLDELLAFLACPEEHRRKVRTTNAIERAFREVRRRTRPMSCFTNDASCERIIYAVVSHLNRSWEGQVSPEFPHK
jgi:transposase-like protein